jgi:hypothetical protein
VLPGWFALRAPRPGVSGPREPLTLRIAVRARSVAVTSVTLNGQPSAELIPSLEREASAATR